MKYGFSGRYAEILQELLDDLNAVKALHIKYDDDYQGFVDVDYLLIDNRVFSYKYIYGSCEMCDDWEHRQLSDNTIKQEMLREATIFDTLEHYREWCKMRNKKEIKYFSTF